MRDVINMDNQDKLVGKDTEWTTVEPLTWKPEAEGDSITGVLIAREVKTEDLSARYSLENEQGLWLVWGSAVLDDRMKYVSIGDKIRITFKGEVANKNPRFNPTKIFKVEVAKQTSVPQETKIEDVIDEPKKAEASA